MGGAGKFYKLPRECCVHPSVPDEAVFQQQNPFFKSVNNVPGNAHYGCHSRLAELEALGVGFRNLSHRSSWSFLGKPEFENHCLKLIMC